MLRLEDVHVHIGKLHILQGVSLEVAQGECAALLGRNGVGKTTTLRAIMGLAARSRGMIPSVGSSRIMSLGCIIRQRAMASICCSPPESVSADCDARSCSRGKHANTYFSRSGSRLRGSPMQRFSITVRLGNIPRPCGT